MAKKDDETLVLSADQKDPNATVKPLENQERAEDGGYYPEEDERKVYDQFLFRKGELIKSRANVMGINIDDSMRMWDRKYFDRTADIPASEVDAEQKPIAMINAYGKIQAALSIMVDRNPEITLHERNPKFSANRELMKGLATASWQNTNSLGQFKLSIFNCAKRGWFVGRTYNKRLVHKAKFLEKVDDDGKKTWAEKEITKMDDVAYYNINNFNAWIDEQAVPDDFYTARDWMWREVWHIDDIRRIFPESEYPNMKYVQSGGDTSEVRGGLSTVSPSTSSVGNTSKQTKRGMTEIYFYENQFDDWFIVEINGVMVAWEPLPQNSKRLSGLWGYWNLRSAETIYGVGIVEMMEKDEQLIDRINNLTLRQLLITIAPPGFYDGPEDPDNENIKYNAGVLRRMKNTDTIKWLEIPAGNENGPAMIDRLRDHQSYLTGITDAIEGNTAAEGANPTAFQIGVDRESALQRLRLPLKQFQYALEWEFNNRIELIKQVYSDFQVEQIESQEDIMDYLREVNADPKFYFIENEGQPGKEVFYAKRYRQTELSLEQDERGQFVPSEQKKFFHILPEYLIFEGGVTIKVGSLLVQSEELERADTLQMSNIIIPLLNSPPEVVGRPVKQILQAFDYDPKKWLPDAWLAVLYKEDNIVPPQQTPPTPPGGPGPAETPPGAGGPGAQGPETIVPQRQLAPPSLSARMGAAFNAFRSPTGAAK
jgi:hypothetical protein